ncbi:hypothetical protein [Streptomyces sp. GF20]|uniref:hypothetical protein n=1 Tax=unclassified Streptomyces TaxID=2593676 RepID=UPI0013188358|nr:hypothetical protein [Streptomyces sp. GF20]QHC16159.1 hypothetical protein GR131_12255 [Streptomyces sp. GF20]
MATADATPPGRSSSVPEPALRPAPLRGPGAELSTWARLFTDGDALVLRCRGFFGQRREVRYPLSGEHRISRALLISPDADTARSYPGAGEIRLLDPAGRPVARLLPDRWMVSGRQEVPIDQAVERSGAGALLRAAGIPVVRASRADLAAPRESRRRELSLVLEPGPQLPWWYQALRVTAGCLWLLAISVLVIGDRSMPGWVLFAAVAAFAAPVARLLVRGVSALRNRSAAELDPSPLVVISPRPAPAASEQDGAIPTVRFVSRAMLRVFPGELSVVDQYGADARRPLAGPSAPQALVRLIGPDGHPVAVELRYATGPNETIAAWADWFGGPGGAAQWQKFRTATGLHCEDRKASGKAVKVWELARGAYSARPAPDAKHARRESRFPSSAAKGSSSALMVIGSYFSLQFATTVADDAPGIAWTSALLGVAGLLLQFAPWCWHHLRSRLYFERPVTRKDPAS